MKDPHSEESGPRGRRPRWEQVGSLTVELSVMAPVVFLFALLAVGLGRYEMARLEVTDAAHAGAEAASIAPTVSAAEPSAVEASNAGLAQQSHLCPTPIVNVDTSNFFAGGRVAVTVVCHVELSDLMVPGFPGSVVVQETQSAPVDPYRVVG